LHRYEGEVFALNLDGFYNPLKALLDHYVATNMTDRADVDLLHFPETVEDLLEYFK
jgi:predicted Rossmann-fold nucleotide-binding protein